MHLGAVAALLVLTVAVAGCRPDRRQSGERVDPDDPQAACKVVTPADMRAVVNIPPEDNEISAGVWRDVPPISGLAGVTFCRYGDQLRTLTAYVGVSSFDRDATEFARRSFEKWRGETERRAKAEGANDAGVAFQPVKAVGQQAVWAGGDSNGHLVVLDGSRILTITLGGDQAPALDRAKKLAARALRRM